MMLFLSTHFAARIGMYIGFFSRMVGL